MKSAMVVIDVQRGLFDPAPRPYQADRVIQRLRSLTGRARAAKVPVFYVQHQRAEGPLSHGAPGWQLVRELAVEEGDRLIAKTTPDAFSGTELDQYLKQLGVDHLFLGGYASEYCVDTTVRRAAALGYGVSLIADAHTTHDKAHLSAARIRAHHNATLASITSFAGKIGLVPSAQVVFGE